MIRLKFSSRRMQMLLAAGGAAGVFLGTQLAQKPRVEEGHLLSPQALEGVWELHSLNGVTLDVKANLPVLSQRITLREGRIFGETRLRTGSEASTAAMPFPDASVRRVTASPDGFETRVFWDGRCSLRKKNNLDFTIGKAQYRANARWNPQSLTLELDHDAILTYPGTAVYRPARPAEGAQTVSAP